MPKKGLMESPCPEARCLQAAVDVVPQRLGWCLAKVDVTLTSRTKGVFSCVVLIAVIMELAAQCQLEHLSS